MRQLECCSGDLADLKVKSCDIEAWSPRQQKYFEVCSCSNLGDAQARRLKMRVKGEDGKMYLPHTLNNTVVAPPRMLIAFLENHLQADGSVTIPEVLWQYMKKTLALVLAAILTLSLCACGGSAEEGLLTTEKPQTSQVAGTPTDLPDETPEATGTPEESAAPSAKPTAEPVQKPAATQKPTATQKPAVTPAKTAEELKTLMAAVVDGTDAIKMASTDEVSRDSFKDIVGIDYADGYTAVVYQPMTRNTSMIASASVLTTS